MVSIRRMVAGFGILLLLLDGYPVFAQTWNEFFKQKKTQISYLGKQIAALQVYIGYARKGYELVGDGINMVKDITSGEFSLHRNFFASLATVSPAVKNSAQVAEIIACQLSILKSVNRWKAAEFSTSEWAYLSLVKANLMAGCAGDIDELLMVVISGKLEMKDNERLLRLNTILAAMRDKYAFALSFSGTLDRLTSQREHDREGISDLEILYGITP